jgi:hypothetical protein
MNTTIDFTKRRLSKSIALCPVCGRKGRKSVDMCQSQDKMLRHVEYFHHAGYKTDQGTTVITDMCTFDVLTGDTTRRMEAEHEEATNER